MTTTTATGPVPRRDRGSPRRIVLWVATVAALVLLIMAVLASWMVNTHRGSEFAFERLSRTLPGTLEVDTLIGSIWGPLEVRKVSYKSERVHITMDRMRVAWSLKALVLRRLDIHDLQADNVRVEVAAAGEKIADKDTLKALPDFRLPLDFMVNHATFQRVRIVSTAADSGLRPDTSIAIDRVVMHKMAFRDTLTVGSLTAHSPLGDVELSGGGRTHTGYRADFKLTWKLHPPQFAEISGVGTLKGSLDTLRVDQTIDGPLQADVNALVYEPTRDMRLNGRMVVHRLDANAFDPRLPEGHASGELILQGRPLDFVTTGRMDANTRAYGRARVDWNVQRKKNVVRVVNFGVTPHGRRGHLAARGSLEPGGRRRVDLVANWTGMAWPLAGEPAFVTPRGSLRLGGTLDRWQLASDAMVGVPALQDTARMRVRGTGDTRGLAVSMATIGVFGGEVSGRGRFAWSPGPSWDLAITGRDLDPGTRWPAFPGSIAFTGTSRGRLTASGPIGSVLLREMSGTLREQPLTGHARLGLAGATTHVAAFELAFGPNRLTASGDIGPRYALQWALDAPDLGAVLPRGYGTLAAHGTVSGPRAAPRLVAEATGDSIRWEKYGLDHLAVNLDLGSGNSGPLVLAVDAAKVRIAPRTFQHVGLHGDGTRGSHTLTFTAASREDSLGVALAGGLAGMREWRGELRTLNLTTPNFGSWSLERPARLAIATDAGAVREFTWRSGDARVLADATWARGGSWTLRSTLEQVPLSLLGSYVPPDLELDAPVAGTLDFRGRGTSVFGDANLTLGPGELRYPTGNRKKVTEQLERSTLTAHADGSGLNAHLAVGLVPAGTIEANVRMPGFTPARVQDGSQPITGMAALRIQNLRVAQAFISSVTNTEGALDAQVHLLGTTSQPRWTGDVQLAQGAADVPRFGLALREGQLVARGDESGRLSFDGGLRSGDGRLAVKGTATVRQAGLAALDATVAGQRLLLSDTRDLRIVASPDLRVTVEDDSLMVRGEVEVPEADVREPRKRDPITRPSKDVRYVGLVEEERKREPLRVHSEVRIVLGDDIRVRAKSLDGRPSGSVLTIKTPGQPLLATGQLNIRDGKYRVYGRSFTIESGRLAFGGGPIANPGLDFRATRRARDGVTAGFEVHGTLEAPRVSVFSDPPMGERDALSYALFGRSLDPGNQNEQSIMNDAANSLSLRGGNYVTGTLARQLGLDEATIESESGTFENSSLRLGAYLSPRVYVNYGVGILDQVSTLRIQYFLSRMWTLQAEAGPENSAQVLYTFERGRSMAPPPRPAPARRDSVLTLRERASQIVPRRASGGR